MQRVTVLPMDDIGAKRMFQEEAVRRGFISAVLGIPIEKIQATRLMNTHLLRRFFQDKEGILDIAIELTDLTRILIEIQVAEYKYWDRRNLYYLSKSFVDTVAAGQDYQEVKKCISINVLDFNYLNTQKCHTVFRWRDEDGNLYTDLQEIHIIEINKAAECDTEISEWIKLFRCRKKEELDMLRSQTKNQGIQTAIEVLREMSLSKRLRADWDFYQKRRRDRNAREEFVYDKGVAEGRTEGTLWGKVQSVDTVKDKMNLSLEEACEMLGMTVEEYREQKRQMNQE